jgi:phosphinothricin acetyltransferase
MSTTIRRATPADAAAVLSIYAPIIEGTAISFETEIPSEAETADRIEKAIETHSWLVAEDGGRVLGYAYAGIFRMRSAYAPSTEVSVYIDEGARGKGVGRALVVALLDELKVGGFANAFAGVTLPNDASVRLFESLGFTYVGVFKRVGFKFDRWHDVAWWQLRLDEPQES